MQNIDANKYSLRIGGSVFSLSCWRACRLIDGRVVLNACKRQGVNGFGSDELRAKPQKKEKREVDKEQNGEIKIV